MPLNKKGKNIMATMLRQYGKEKGKKVFYASESSGAIEGVTGRESRLNKKLKRR